MKRCGLRTLSLLGGVVPNLSQTSLVVLALLHGAKLIANRIPIMMLQILSSIPLISGARTEMLLKSSSEIILWCLNMLLKEIVDTRKLTPQYGFIR